MTTGARSWRERRRGAKGLRHGLPGGASSEGVSVQRLGRDSGDQQSPQRQLALAAATPSIWSYPDSLSFVPPFGDHPAVSSFFAGVEGWPAVFRYRHVGSPTAGYHWWCALTPPLRKSQPVTPLCLGFAVVFEADCASASLPNIRVVHNRAPFLFWWLK